MSELFKALAQSDEKASASAERCEPYALSSSSAAGKGVAWRHLEQPEQPREESASLDEMFSRLWRAKISLFAGAVAGALVMVLIGALATPVYRARTAIRLEELNERFPNLPDMLSGSASASGESYLQNELKILQSDSLAKRVAIRLGLDPAPPPDGILARTERTLLGSLPAPFHSASRSPSPDDLRISAVQKALTIRSSLKSQVVEILFDSRDPLLAAQGANTVVSEYVALNREARLQAGQETTEWLAQQIPDLKAKLDKGNEELQAYARSAGLLYAANQSLLSEEKARQIQEELSKAHADRVAKQSRYEAAVSNSPEALPVGADSGLLREYEGKLATVQGELTQYRAMYTPAHYKVAEAEARAAQLEAAIREERQRIISRMRAEYDAARRLEASLTTTYEAQTRELTEQTSEAFRYNVLKRDMESTQQLYNSLMQKSKEAGITSAMRATSVRVIDAARPPVSPYSPNLPVNAAIGFSGGLFLAAGVGLLRKRDSYLSANQPSDCQRLDVRELGVIPSARRRRSHHWPAGLFAAHRNNSGVELVTWHEQPSILTEAFRATLASILFSPLFDAQRHGILTVTSVQPQEGKTTAVSNLGIALAETHGRILLIDADLRRPRIHEIFEHCNDTGLTTILTSDEPIATMDLEPLIRQTNVPGLFTIPSGPGAPSVTPLLYSARMSAFLARVRKEFDFILIDTPPTALFSDARILGRHSDGVIVVIHAARMTRAELNTVCLKFMKDGTPVLGTIVNHTASRQRGYERYTKKRA